MVSYLNSLPLDTAEEFAVEVTRLLRPVVAGQIELAELGTHP